MAVFLGIDGGGTKTTCAVADDATVLASATAAGSNIVRLGEAQARASLREVIEKACSSAGVDPSRVQRTVMGAAGASVPDVRARLRTIIGEVAGGEVEIVGDMVIALEAAFAGSPGVIVIAGTGSIAYGRNQQGITARAGGWGYAISDEGSGHWIGRRAVSAALTAHDSGSDRLLTAILSAWNLSSVDELVKVANASPPPDFAQLFPVALEHLGSTRSGSVWRIFDDAGQELAKLAAIVLRRLWPQESRVTVAVMGGVFAHAPLVRKSFEAVVQKSWPGVTVKPEKAEPVEGALWLARRPAAAPLSRSI
jgi:N-acetylglucosamine kinase-like BadF-type ATPase